MNTMNLFNAGIKNRFQKSALNCLNAILKHKKGTQVPKR